MQHIFENARTRFDLPEGVIYLDGNSLGPLQHAVKERVSREIAREWGQKLIRGWNESGWMDLPSTVGNRIARLVGAEKGSVVVADSTSVNIYKVLTAALAMRPERRVVLSDNGNFPTDLYVAQGALRSLGKGHELKIVAPEDVMDEIDDTIAVVMLTEVDYRTGRLHDMRDLTRRAHDAGASVIWDLAHSAGALPVDLAGCKADFAVGCSYKYLNGGPGAPAFLYVRPDLAGAAEPALCGWMGHAEPFAFDPDYRPASGSDRLRVGTPPVLAMAALDTALAVWDEVTMEEVRTRSIELSERFIAEMELRCPQLRLASPREPARRGSQVSFRFNEGYAAMQAAIAAGVIGDFRAPDIMRFGFAPLYIRQEDVIEAARRIERIMSERLWDRPEYMKRARVT